MPAISLSVLEVGGGGFASGAGLAGGGGFEVVAGSDSREVEVEVEFPVGSVGFAVGRGCSVDSSGFVGEVKERVDRREVVAVEVGLLEVIVDRVKSDEVHIVTGSSVVCDVGT